jgi:hypothetical protein
MKACVWYRVDEKTPPRSGYYLAFRGMSMGDDTTAVDYFYYNAKQHEWREGDYSAAHWANVFYWTDADPKAWYDNHSPRKEVNTSVAEQDALAAVKQAIERYEMVRALCAETR